MISNFKIGKIINLSRIIRNSLPVELFVRYLVKINTFLPYVRLLILKLKFEIKEIKVHNKEIKSHILFHLLFFRKYIEGIKYRIDKIDVMKNNSGKIYARKIIIMMTYLYWNER